MWSGGLACLVSEPVLTTPRLSCIPDCGLRLGPLPPWHFFASCGFFGTRLFPPRNMGSQGTLRPSCLLQHFTWYLAQAGAQWAPVGWQCGSLRLGPCFPVVETAQQGWPPSMCEVSGFIRNFYSHEVISLPEQAGEWGNVFVPIAQVRNRGLRGR